MRAAVVDRTEITSRARRNRLVTLRELPTPTPHAPGWVVVRPALSGICGSDLSLLDRSSDRTVLTAYRGRERLVPGHEVVGVVQATWAASPVSEGTRVIVDPTLRCVHKGLPECGRCRAGDGHQCENADRPGPLCSGPMVGFSERAGGGWSEGFLVHEDMLLPADGIPDHRAVLAEPAAAALHAALRWRRQGDRAVVLGSGTAGRLVVAALARLHEGLEISVVHDDALLPRRGRAASVTPSDMEGLRALGAARIWHASGERLIEEVAAAVNGRVLRARGASLPVIDSGVDAVFDCRAAGPSVDLGLRLLRSGGTLVLAGPTRRQQVDWSMVWWRELTVQGSSNCGREADGRRSFSIAREWLADPAYPIDRLVTHRYLLDSIGTALDTARAGAAVGAVKVVIEGPGAQRSVRQQADPDRHGEVFGAGIRAATVLRELPAESDPPYATGEVPGGSGGGGDPLRRRARAWATRLIPALSTTMRVSRLRSRRRR